MVDKLVPVEVVDGGKSTFSPFLYQPIYQEGANATSNGTVVSVGQSFTGGLISVSGSPITTSGTLALTVVGTSGGIPYFSAANAWASSAALASNALVVGGGAGASPATVSTGTGVLAALANNTGSAGSFVINGGALGTPASGTVTNLTGTASININGTVGATTANTGAFTTLSASSTVSGTGFSTYLASPPAIGGTTPAAGTFTTVKAIAASTQDSVILQGRAGGTSSYGVTLSPTTLTASRNVTFPNADINFVTGLGTAQGGTGLTSFTANGVVYASSSSALTTGTQLSWDGSYFSAQSSSTNGVIRTGRTTNLSPIQDIGYFSFYAPNASGTPKSWGYLRAFSGDVTAGSESSILYFANIQGGTTTEVLTINATGNLAIGTLSSGWGTSYKAFEFAGAMGFAILTTSSILYVSNNAYHDGTTWRYRSFSTIPASQYRQYSGRHVWLTAPAGGGNSPLTFTEQMTLDADDNLQMQAGAIMPYTPAPELITGAVTPLTNAQLQTQILNCAGTGAYTLTMPTGSTLDSLADWTQSNVGYDFIVINTRATGTITMAVNTGVTSVGSLSVLANISARYRIRRTGFGNYILYRI
jgi:hypothetical protein